MSSQTRWSFNGNTNELVAVMLAWEFAGATDPTRTPMLVDGVDQSASIQGTAVSSIQRGGVGLYNLNLRETWPWLLGDDLKVTTPRADTAAPYTVKVCDDQADYQTGPTPFIRIQVFDAAGALADPPVDHQLRGMLTFRNRRVGSLSMAGLMIALGKPKGAEAEEEMGDEAMAEDSTTDSTTETTPAQRAAGKALASALKSGDGEAVYLAFAELHAMCADADEGEASDSTEY